MGRPVDPNSKTSRILRVFDDLKPSFTDRDGSCDFKALQNAISKRTTIDVVYVRAMLYKYRPNSGKRRSPSKVLVNTKTNVSQEYKLQKTVQYVMECGGLSTARQHLDALAAILSA